MNLADEETFLTIVNTKASPIGGSSFSFPAFWLSHPAPALSLENRRVFLMIRQKGLKQIGTDCQREQILSAITCGTLDVSLEGNYELQRNQDSLPYHPVQTA